MKSILTLSLALIMLPVMAQEIKSSSIKDNPTFNTQVEQFLASHKNQWRDMNVPVEDGKILHDIIVSKRYQSALEIGTSTGHSTIWIAWAMSKTGGKVITLELNEKRHREAIKNLKEAGLLEYVDARLGDAHHFVKELPGPFDFVFSDADKDWYKKYFMDLEPKLKKEGCFTTHNVADGLADQDFLNYVKNHPKFQTTIDRTSRAGVMISYKIKD